MIVTTNYTFALTNQQLRITATSLVMFILEGMLVLMCPFSLDAKTINTSHIDNTRTLRWNDKARLAYYAVYEVGPHVHTSLTGAAAF